MGVLKELRYLTAHDVQSRIGNSVIRYKGRPVFCSVYLEDREDLRVNLVSPTDGSRFIGIHSSDEDIDVKAFTIGYVNRPVIAQAFYATRIPARRPKQGLSADNTVYWYTDKQSGNRLTQGLGRSELTSHAFFEMLNNVYPSLDKSLSLLKDAPRLNKFNEASFPSCAFDRKFSVSEDEIGCIKLNFFAQPIAMFNSKKQEFVLSERLAHYLPVLKSFGIPSTVN